MLSPPKIPFPHADTKIEESFLNSLLIQHWEIKDPDLVAKIIVKEPFPQNTAEQPAKIIWYGNGPIEKEIFKKIHVQMPNITIVGYLDDKGFHPLEDKHPHAPLPTLEHLISTDFDLMFFAEDTPAVHRLKKKLIQAGIPEEKLFNPLQKEIYKTQIHLTHNSLKDEFLNTITACCKNKKILFFIVTQRGSCPSVEFLAQSLKEQDNEFILVAAYLFTPPPNNVFEHAIYCRGSFHLLADFLQVLPIHLVYVQAHFKWAFLSQFIYAINKSLPIIHEVNDWMETFIDTPTAIAAAEEEGLWSTIELKTIQHGEDYLTNNIAGFIYKNGGQWMIDKVAKSKTPSLQLLPSQPKKMNRPPQPRSDKTEWRLVFAGKVAATQASKHFFDDIKLLPLFQDLTKQELQVTIWNSPIFNNDQLRIFFSDYYQESITNPYFQFIPGVSIEKIIDKLNGNFDFGLMLYHFNPELSIGKHHLAGSMATKIFTYLSAGLPILISPELEYMADFVVKNKIGLIIKRCETTSLKDMLHQCDYASLLEHVAEAQYKYCAEENSDKFISFIESIL